MSPLPFPPTVPVFHEMQRLRGQILGAIEHLHQTPSMRKFVDAVTAIEDGIRDRRESGFVALAQTAAAEYPLALADARAAQTRFQITGGPPPDLFATAPTTLSVASPSLPVSAGQSSARADIARDSSMPAPWAYEPMRLNIGGVESLLHSPAPIIPETITSGLEAITLGTIIKTVPEPQHTRAMTELCERLSPRLKAERHANASGRTADIPQLDAELISLYPQALKDTRAILDTPARRLASSADIARAAEALGLQVASSQPLADPLPLSASTSGATPPETPHLIMQAESSRQEEMPMNVPESPSVDTTSFEELVHLKEDLVRIVAPLFTWESTSLVSAFVFTVTCAELEHSAGNTIAFERAVRRASDLRDQALAEVGAKIASQRSKASPPPAPASSGPPSASTSDSGHASHDPGHPRVWMPSQTSASGAALNGTPVAAPIGEPTATSASAVTTVASDGVKLIAGAVAVVNVASIVIADERRAKANQEHVKTLAESIDLIGLHHSPVVTPSGRLVSGLHRVLACGLLGLAEIRVSVVDLTGLQERIAIIDENLVRRDLPPLEHAELIAERKELYEQVHPETVQHRRGGESKAAGGATAIAAVAPAFATETAKLTGRSERSIRQYTQVAKLPQRIRDAVRDTAVANSITELEKLQRLPVTEQSAVAEALHDRRATSVAQAVRLLKITGESDDARPIIADSAAESKYLDTQRSVLAEQRALLQKTAAILGGPVREWTEHHAEVMARHTRRVMRVVTAINAALEEMQGDARLAPEFWGEPAAEADSKPVKLTAAVPSKKAKSNAPTRSTSSKSRGTPTRNRSRPKNQATAKNIHKPRERTRMEES